MNVLAIEAQMTVGTEGDGLQIGTLLFWFS